MKLHHLHIGRVYLTRDPAEADFVLAGAEAPLPEGFDPEAFEQERQFVLEGLRKTLASKRQELEQRHD